MPAEKGRRRLRGQRSEKSAEATNSLRMHREPTTAFSARMAWPCPASRFASWMLTTNRYRRAPKAVCKVAASACSSDVSDVLISAFRPRTAGSTPATSPAWTATATFASPAAPRTSHPRWRKYSGGDREHHLSPSCRLADGDRGTARRTPRRARLCIHRAARGREPELPRTRGLSRTT